MSSDGREDYVANIGDDSVSVIDVAAAKEVARIPVGKAPAQVGFTPDVRRVYVSSTVDDGVAEVDMKQRQRIAPIPVGREPIRVFATPHGRYVYVGNESTKENLDNRASVIEVVQGGRRAGQYHLQGLRPMNATVKFVGPVSPDAKRSGAVSARHWTRPAAGARASMPCASPRPQAS